MTLTDTNRIDMQTAIDKFNNSLSRARNPKDHTNQFVEYYKSADKAAASLIAEKNIPLECQPGCSSCCYQRVTVLAHEVFAITDYVESHFSPSGKKKLIAHLFSYLKEVAQLTDTARDNLCIACPFLHNDSCAIYPVRPMNCRAFHSLDLLSCQIMKEHPIGEDRALDFHNLSLAKLWKEMREAGDYCFQMAGYEGEVYELAAACHAAMTSKSHRKRWSLKQFSNLPI